MIILEHEGVEVDHCLSCAGAWLDAGELARIVEQSGQGSGQLTEALAKGKAGGRSERRCPRCRRHLRTVVIEGEEKAEIDRCSRGHGLWLDRGELETLVRLFSDESHVVRFLADLHQGELPKKLKDGLDG